jgi:hypothetical protein
LRGKESQQPKKLQEYGGQTKQTKWITTPTFKQGKDFRNGKIWFEDDKKGGEAKGGFTSERSTRRGGALF